MDKLRLLICFVWMLSTGAMATTVPRIDVEDLFQKADIVAVVQITAGHTLGKGDESCGAIYSGAVSKQFKGAELTDIEFGHFYGYEVGSRYLLFLTKPGSNYRPLSSTNSAAVAREAEQKQRCESQLTGYQMMHSGYGAMQLTSASGLNFKNAFLVPTRYVRFPDALNKTKANFGERHQYSEIMWIKEDDVVQFLSTLKTGGVALRAD